MRDTRFWMLHGLLPALILLPLLLAFGYWPIDFWVMDQLHDPMSGHWVGGGTWWAKGLIHTAGTQLITLIFLFSLGAWLFSYWDKRFKTWRFPALFVGVSILICTVLIALLKHYSGVHCPDELIRYGGDQPFVPVFGTIPEGSERGACFPGGHSSGAFSLIAFYFLLWESRPQLARRALAGALLLGGIFAVGQWTRGEHFPSHDAWSALICWYVLLMIYLTCFRSRMPAEMRDLVMRRSRGRDWVRRV